MEKLQKYIVLDIGGTLCKLCFVSDDPSTSIPHIKSLTINVHDFSIYFNMFKTFEECYAFIQINFASNLSYHTIALTGGGSYKYFQDFKKFNKTILQVKEFESLTEGLAFFNKHHFSQFVLNVFQKGGNTVEHQRVSFEAIHYPLLIVNIGSGVSILKLSDHKECERVGGTSLGGGYFMGLAKLLLNQSNFLEIQKLAKKGVNQNIDITPQDYKHIPHQLDEASVLISLGKLSENSSKEDIARSLFNMVSFNIAQIALMYSDINHASDVIFTGYFCRDNQFVLSCFAQAFNFFQSKKNNNIKRVYSLMHDGYLGTLGALHLLTKQTN